MLRVRFIKCRWEHLALLFGGAILFMFINNYDFKNLNKTPVIFTADKLITFDRKAVDIDEKRPTIVAKNQTIRTNTSSSVWPTLEILIPLQPSDEGINEFSTLFLRSYSLFWPIRQSNTSLLIVTDEEKANNGTLIDQITREIRSKNSRPKIELPFRVVLNIKPETLSRVDGHSRQQWLMLWAENYTLPDTEYVGFVDTDTVFVTRVTLNDLFDPQGRPIVRPLYGKPLPMWDVVPESTFKATGKKCPFFCMTYFPVIVKVSHLALIRELIQSHLNTETFDEAFFNVSRKPYSQFDLICTYLWYYQRDSYYWVIGQRDPNWTGPVPKGQVENLAEAGITNDLLERHGPHLAVHWNYPAFAFDMGTILATGICYALPENDHRLLGSKNCSTVIKADKRENAINPYEWTFEWAVLSHDPTKSLQAHRRRLKIIDTVPIDWEEAEIRPFFKN